MSKVTNNYHKDLIELHDKIKNAPIAYAVRGIESGEIVGLYLSKLSSVNEGLEQFPVKLLPMEVE